MSYKELNVLLVKEQPSRIVQGMNLVYTDFSMLGIDFDLIFKQEQNQIPLRTGQYGKLQDLPGKASIDFKGTSYLSVNGINEPMFSRYLKSCGYVMTRVTGTTTADTASGDKTVTPASMTGIEAGTLCSFSAGFAETTQIYEVDTVGETTIEMKVAATGTQTGVTMVFYKRERQWAPSSIFDEWTYLTMWKYTGLKGSGLSKLTKAYSILCDYVLEGVLGEPIKINFTGRGCCEVVPSDATYVSGTLTPPSDTIPTMLKSSVASVGDQTYPILKVSIAPKNKIDLVKSGTATFGYKYSDISNTDQSSIEVKLTVYQNTNDPHTKLASGVLGSFNIDCGDTLLGAHISSPNGYFQILDVAEAEDGKINTWDIVGKIALNDIVITTGEA
jgi:hypothetical protein